MGVLGTNVRRRVSRLLLSAALLAAFAATQAACGDSTTTKASAPTTTQTPAGTAAPRDRTWERIVPGGDCQCSDGSEFSFWVRKANPEKVALLPPRRRRLLLRRDVRAGQRPLPHHDRRGPDRRGWHLRLRRRAQPVRRLLRRLRPVLHGRRAPRQHHHRVRPRPHRAPQGLRQRHRRARPPGRHRSPARPTSSWSARAPARSPRRCTPGSSSDRLPDARITVLADGSGSYPDVPRDQRDHRRLGLRHAPSRRWPENAGPTAEQWSFPGCSSRADGTTPRSSSPATTTPTTSSSSAGTRSPASPRGDLLSLIDANETQIEARRREPAQLHRAGRRAHRAQRRDRSTPRQVNGQPLVDWVTRLVERKPVDDVHCRNCRAR